MSPPPATATVDRVGVLDEEQLRVLTGTGIANIATVMPDGSPQVTPIWVDSDGGDVLVNTSEGTVKLSNLRADPRVALSVPDPDDPYRVLAVRGRVVGETTGPEAEAHIDKLSRRYDGTPWEPEPGMGGRVLLRIRPDRVVWV